MTTTTFDQLQFNSRELNGYDIPFQVKREEGVDLPYNFFSNHLQEDPSFRRRDWFLDDLDRSLRHTFVMKCRPDLFDYFNSSIGDLLDKKVKRIWRKNRVQFLKAFESSYKEYLNPTE